MKPIYLKMTAFSSYCGTAEIDFTKLYENGIFLITGKTGGGKTTILDAICTALYGKATGSMRSSDWRQLRCINAPDSRDTEIEFIFSTGGVKYQFYRRWHMPNSRKGTPGLRDEEDCCRRQKPGSDDWELLVSGSATSVTNEAVKIIGLTHDQFVKLIMLPQGEFRELLTADDKKKLEIFSKLFDTGHWNRIIDAARNKREKLDKECGEKRLLRQSALDSAGCATPDELNAKIQQTEERLKELEEQAGVNTRNTTAASEEWRKGKELAGLFDDQKRAESAWKELQAQEAPFESKRQRLRHSRKLGGALPEFSMMNAAADAEKRASEELARAQTAKDAAVRRLETAGAEYGRIPELEEKRTRLTETSAKLKDLASSRVSHEQTNAQLARHTAEQDNEREQLRQYEEKKTTLSEAVRKGDEFLESCRAASAALPAVISKCSRLRQELDTAREYERHQQALSRTEQSVRATESEIQRKESALAAQQKTASDMEQAIRGDKAYSLAADLEEGVPCPVCGAVHHPSPARPAGTVPTAQQLHSAREDAEKTARELEALRSQRSGLLREKEIYSGAMAAIIEKSAGGEIRSPAVIQKEFDAAEKERVELESTEGKTERARLKLEKLKAELDAVSHDIENHNTRFNNLQNEITVCRTTLRQLDERLQSQGIAGFDELEQRLNAAERQLQTTGNEIARLTAAYQDAQTREAQARSLFTQVEKAQAEAAEDLRRRQSEFAEKCARLVIPENSDFIGGVLSPADEAAYDRAISEFEQKLAAARSKAEELSSRIAGKTRPDTAALEAAYNNAMAEGQRISGEKGEQSSLLEGLKQHRETIRRADAELQALEKRFAVAQDMHLLLSNKNISKMSIDRYVIGIKMDEIILHANAYLGRLSRGQYAMKRIESGTNKINQSLSIEIIDGSTGGVRSVFTLSGGEMFLASLALAFGLSETVQSFAGGIHLDSLFIDEGFGSLDRETLDTAMDAIARVREDRLLGIISHISELQERVPFGIEVIKDRDGSSLRLKA